MFPAWTRYNWSVIGLMAVYSVLCFAVPEIMGAMTGRGALAVLIAASPVYPLVAVFYLYVRQLGELDELQQRIQLLSLAIATGITLIGMTGYGFIALHMATPEYPAILILPAFVVVWCFSAMIVKRRYQ